MTWFDDILFAAVAERARVDGENRLPRRRPARARRKAEDGPAQRSAPPPPHGSAEQRPEDGVQHGAGTEALAAPGSARRPRAGAAPAHRADRGAILRRR